MSLRQLDGFFNNSELTLQLALNSRRRQFKRSWLSAKRQFKAAYKRQYFITDSLNEAGRAIKTNEDIFLSVASLAAILVIGAISLASNIILTFMLDSSYLSSLLGANLILIYLAAVGVLSVSFFWLLSFCQNMLATALIDGANRRQKKSLRSTISRSISKAAPIASAWASILSIAILPAVALVLATWGILYAFGLKPAAIIPYAIGSVIIGLSWFVLVVTNLSLAPSAILLGHAKDNTEAFKLSRQLLSNKGQWFIAGWYGLLLVLAAVSTGLAWIIDQLTGLNMPMLVATAMMLWLAVFNASLTMLYQKRRRARS